MATIAAIAAIAAIAVAAIVAIIALCFSFLVSSIERQRGCGDGEPVIDDSNDGTTGIEVADFEEGRSGNRESVRM